MKRLALAALLGLVVAAISASSASAHDYCEYHGQDRGCLVHNHTTLTIRDNECDGMRAHNRGWYAHGSNPDEYVYIVADPDGCGGEPGVRSGLPTIIDIFVCEGRDGWSDGCNLYGIQ